MKVRSAICAIGALRNHGYFFQSLGSVSMSAIRGHSWVENVREKEDGETLCK